MSEIPTGSTGRSILKREFEIYREREMRQLESDFDKAVKRQRRGKDKDGLKSKLDKEMHSNKA